MEHNIKLRAFSAPWYSGIDLLVKKGDSYGVNITMQTMEEGLTVEPTLSIGMQEAQILMDDLWASGIRPTEGSGSAGSLKATEKHLSDMRKIAYKYLNIEKDG